MSRRTTESEKNDGMVTTADDSHIVKAENGSNDLATEEDISRLWLCELMNDADAMDSDIRESALEGFSGIVEKVPVIGKVVDFVSTAVDSIKAINNITKEHRQRNFNDFLQGIANGGLTKEEVAKFEESIKKGDWDKEIFLYTAKSINDAFETGKMKWYSGLFITAAENRICADVYMEYVSILSKAFYSDINALTGIWDNLNEYGYILVESSLWVNLDRLSGYGIGERRSPVGDNFERVTEDVNAYFYYSEYAKGFMNAILLKRDMTRDNIPVDSASPKVPMDDRKIVLNCGNASTNND